MWCWSTPVYLGIPQEISDETTGEVKKTCLPSVSSLFQTREGSTHHLLECQADIGGASINGVTRG